MMEIEMRDWREKNVVILGAARQGIATAQYLVSKNANIVLSDLKSEDLLKDAKKELNGLIVNGQRVEWIYGEHPLQLLNYCDALIVSGGVPLTIPIVQEAIKQGIPILNDSQIFLEIAPCPVIGITGSAGKTTTTSLTGKIFETASKNPESVIFQKKIWVGGNIGTPLISSLKSIDSNDLVILELSSFQLEIMNVSPDVAVLLNIAPDHLDRHSSLETYVNAKSNIFRYQSKEDVAIVLRDDKDVCKLVSVSQGIPMSFGLTDLPDSEQGTYIKNDRIYFRSQDEHRIKKMESSAGGVNDFSSIPLLVIEKILLKGEHNLLNVMAACTIASAMGLSFTDISRGVEGFQGVPNRLEFVRSWASADWYNDSIATTPARTAAAIKSFSEPLILLAGGRNKNLSWREYADLIEERVDHLIVFGENADMIVRDLSNKNGSGFPAVHCNSLQDAVMAAVEIVQPGDVVLLSPGGTSFDEFKDYEERGECFKKWVRDLK